MSRQIAQATIPATSAGTWAVTRKHNAPKDIDYLSIDTEGSEFEILSAHDFSEYSFKVIPCEHNFTDMREKIHDLLSAQGYVRKYENLSKFDDWYVRS
jgi:hypothetical protein